jgi:hypothetical protein
MYPSNDPVIVRIQFLLREQCPYGGSNGEISWLGLESLNIVAKSAFYPYMSFQDEKEVDPLKR